MIYIYMIIYIYDYIYMIIYIYDYIYMIIYICLYIYMLIYLTVDLNFGHPKQLDPFFYLENLACNLWQASSLIGFRMISDVWIWYLKN